MITVKNLNKQFENNHVLRGIDYHIHQGEKIVIIGPSRFRKKYLSSLPESDGAPHKR